METYMYRAAMLCGPCGVNARFEITNEGNAPEDPDDECTYDSDNFPKGPIHGFEREADYPDHCDECGLFLKNNLTDEGRRYLQEQVDEQGDSPNAIVKEWVAFYG